GARRRVLRRRQEAARAVSLLLFARLGDEDLAARRPESVLHDGRQPTGLVRFAHVGHRAAQRVHRSCRRDVLDADAMDHSIVVVARPTNASAAALRKRSRCQTIARLRGGMRLPKGSATYAGLRGLTTSCGTTATPSPSATSPTRVPLSSLRK